MKLQRAIARVWLSQAAQVTNTRSSVRRHVDAAPRIVSALLVGLLLTVSGQLCDVPECPAESTPGSVCVADEVDSSFTVAPLQEQDVSGSTAPARIPPAHVMSHIHGQHSVLLAPIALPPLLICLASLIRFYAAPFRRRSAPPAPPPRPIHL